MAIDLSMIATIMSLGAQALTNDGAKFLAARLGDRHRRHRPGRWYRHPGRGSDGSHRAQSGSRRRGYHQHDSGHRPSQKRWVFIR